MVIGPLFFIRHRQGRVATLASLFFVVLQFPLLHAVGVTFLLSVPHLLLWIPLLIYLSRELKSGSIRMRSAFGAWTLIAIATMLYSLVFDVRDFIRWIAGERGIINPGMQLDFPWMTLPALIAAFAVMGYYLFNDRQPA